MIKVASSRGIGPLAAMGRQIRDARSALPPAAEASSPIRHSLFTIRSNSNRFKHLVTGVPGLFVVSPPRPWPFAVRQPLADLAAMDAVEGRVTRLPEVRR